MRTTGVHEQDGLDNPDRLPEPVAQVRVLPGAPTAVDQLGPMPVASPQTSTVLPPTVDPTVDLGPTEQLAGLRGRLGVSSPWESRFAWAGRPCRPTPPRAGSTPRPSLP